MNNECWLEMDLYWFQGKPHEDKISELFDRLTPLWQRSPGARKGLSLCVGWLFDSVLYWNGSPDSHIVCCQGPTYEPWTYRRLSELVGALRNEAQRRGISRFHVGIALMGIETQSWPHIPGQGWSGRTEQKEHIAHYDIKGKWFFEHPEVVDERLGKFSFGKNVRIPPDEAVCKHDESVFGDYFADKFCDFARYTGFDAVIFRDFVFTAAYVRSPGKGRYMLPEARAELTESFIRLFAALKAQLPPLVIIGYSSGTSAIEELRSHGFDLERVAADGNLDLWITQTWASAWQDYWPCHSMGYTFQLADVLVHQTMLAKTPCKHLFLIETFDAWEPWDSIHQYPGKVGWEIWAYSHAAVLTPEGLSRSAGFYASWMNRRQHLLPEPTVQWLCATLDACALDLAEDPIPGGPCLVYHRNGLEFLLDSRVDHSRGEEIDDWAAMIMKLGVPILSITRSEWLPKIRADAFVFAASAWLDESQTNWILKQLENRTPILFLGQASLLPNTLRDALGVRCAEEPVRTSLPVPTTLALPLAEQIGTLGVIINQRYRSLEESDTWTPLIHCMEGPVFSRHKRLPCWIWETPEWGTPRELDLRPVSIQSPQTYAAVAASFADMGWGPEKFRWHNADWQRPICFLFWRQNSAIHILLGNLETGIMGNSQYGVQGHLSSDVPLSLGQPPEPDPGASIKVEDGNLVIGLCAHTVRHWTLTRQEEI